MALLGLVHLALRAHGRGVPLITDEGEYAVAARAWSRGELPYLAAFSQKPPMTFLLYRLPWSPRATAAAFSLGVMAALFFTVPAAAPLAARLAAPAAYASLSTLPLGDYGFPANTEVFLNLFAALAVWAFSRGRAGLAGAFLGAAFMTKQTSAFVALALLALALRLHGRAALLRGLAGAAVVPAAFSLYFASRHAHAAYWDAAFGGNTRYAAVLLLTGAAGSQVRWFLTSVLPSLLLYWAPALGLLVWGLKGLVVDRRRAVETAAVLWLGGAVAGALTGLFLFPHYFLQVAAPLALCAGLGVARVSSPRAGAAAVALLALWPALLSPRLYFLASPREVAVRLLHPNPLFEVKLLGEEIARRARPGDRLHVFGSEGALFVYSGLDPATRHTLSYAVTLFPESARAVEEEYASLGAGPRFLVWSCQPLSTMVSNAASRRYAERLERELLPRYRYRGKVEVTGGPPAFSPAAPGEAPDLTPGDRLLLFERPIPL
ncbi:MAG: hypothetical protein SF051_00535 [Elusimicrobiota bacterium]|nr:hypothetical protein [Elusimicrobiota bacterium]